MYKMVDPVTLQVIHHRLTSITEEMENALLKSSCSSIVKDAKDASTAIFDARGQAIAQACAIPIHVGTLRFSVPEILKKFPARKAKEGDVYMANDPYSGGTHLPDVTLVTPVIYQGEVVALSVSMVHHQDIGAMTPGVPTSATSIYQEGLTLPPLKFYDSGELVEVVENIIGKNVRVPELVLGDMHAQVAAGNVGKVRILELFQEYGKELVLSAMEQLLDHAEALMRSELEKIPDGTYCNVAYMDNDGVDLDRRVKIQVAVTIKGSDFIVDFSGSSPQVRGAINCVPASSCGAVCFVLSAITSGSDIPNNEGSLRPIKAILPEGSIVNPYPPSACGTRSFALHTIGHALMGAVAQFVPERVIACSGNMAILYLGGIDPLNNKEYLVTEFVKEGQGARSTKDGVDAIATELCNTMVPPIEALEMDSPYRFLEFKLCEDSGGAGKCRGGLGTRKVLKLLRGNNASVTYRGEQMFVSPWGLFGGLPGACGKGVIVRKTGEREEVPSKKDFRMNEGDELHIVASGGGGYGDPLERKPELVLRDALDGKISFKAAADDYGVIIDEESLAINQQRTDELRESKARGRGPITWIYDRGAEGKE